MASLLALSDQQPSERDAALAQMYQTITDQTEKQKQGMFSGIAGLLGIGGPPATETISAPPLAHYPDAADVAAARQGDFSYGSGNEAFNSGRTANLLGIPAKGHYLSELSDPRAGNPAPGTPDTGQNYEAAQLAINRSPIAALGYDPHRINLDTESGTNTNIVGAYTPDTDRIYSNAAYPSNLVHESTHRGLEMLRQAGLVSPELEKRLPKDEEKIVRYIMATAIGDPEKGRGPSGDKQRSDALWAFGRKVDDPQAPSPNRYTDDTGKALDDLNAIASRYLLSLHPGGPR